MPLIKVWKHDRSVKKMCMAKTLQDLAEYAYNILGYEKNQQLSVVFESDGTEVESDFIFQCLIEEGSFPATILMIVPEGCCWISAEHKTSPDTVTSASIVPASRSDLVPTVSNLPSLDCVPVVSACHPNPELHSYKVPWDNLSEFVDYCKKEKRPPSTVRREAIRQIVESIRRINTRPPRKFIEKVAREIVAMYPKSLGDAAGNKNYEHFFEQLENRMYHCNRNNKCKPSLRINLLQGIGADKNDDRNGALVPPRRMRDEHGCINWQPDKYPGEETIKTQEEKRDWLKAQSVLREDNDEISSVMDKTYVQQRLDINKKNFTIDFIYVEWPYLFVTSHFLNHTKHLMGFDAQEKWRNELERKVPKIIDYFRSIPNKSVLYSKIQKTLSDVNASVQQSKSKVSEECGILILLCRYFGEDESLLVRYFEKTMTEEEVLLQTNEATKLPVIAVLGNSTLQDPECYVCVEGKAIGSKSNFKQQQIVLFMAYYVFNFHYPQRAAATLEFIQRAILKIDPVDGGHKRHGKRKRTSVHPKVHTLLNNICTYDSLWFC